MLSLLLIRISIHAAQFLSEGRKIMLLGVFLLFATGLSCGAPLQKENEAMEYLVQFGYMNPKEMNIMKAGIGMTGEKMETMMSSALAEFQNFVGLKRTGRMDAETYGMMTKPRCGMKDMHDFDDDNDESQRRKRYATFGRAPWMKHKLTYMIHNYPSAGIPQSAVNEEIERALSTWASVAELDFSLTPKNNFADINITFTRRQHGDRQAFDGVGMILAHAFPPPIGKVHFDDEEPWSIRSYAGQDIFHTAVHEFGHSLGLDHSRIKKSVMFPIARGFNPAFKLHEDDIQGIQALYGMKVSPPDLCTNSTFDAIFESIERVIYVLKDDFLWTLGSDGFINGHPQLISEHWAGLPSNIDAALTEPSGKIHFFKRDLCWIYDYNQKLVEGYPKPISEVWPGVPHTIDAAMHYRKSVYFIFKGDQYWKYDRNKEPGLRDLYPKPVTKWGGIVGDLDDVLKIGHSIYFFRKGYYYRFNSITGLIDVGWPEGISYPRSTGSWWFRCSKPKSSSDCGDLSFAPQMYPGSDKAQVGNSADATFCCRPIIIFIWFIAVNCILHYLPETLFLKS